MAMTTRASFSLGVAATLLMVLIVGAAAGALAQNTGGRPGPFMAQGGPPPGGPGGRGPGGRGGPMGAPGPLGPIVRQLNLSDAQQDQVRGIMQSHRDEMQALGERARTARQALQAALSSETFDEATVRARSADVAAVDADQAVLQARIYSETLQVLTPEQRAQAKKLQAEMKERRPERGRGQRPPQ